MKIALIQNISVADHRMVHIDNIASELVRRGYNVDVIIQNTPAYTSTKNAKPYKIICLPGETYSILNQGFFSYHLFKFLNKNEYNVIHAKNPFSSVLPALFHRRARPRSKIIYDIRGLWIDFGVYTGYYPRIFVPILNYLDVKCMNKSDAVIAISQELKRILINRGVEKRKIKVVMGAGVNLNRNYNIEDIKQHLHIDGKIIGYIGSIGKARSSDKIINAFEILKQTFNHNLYLAMVGPFGQGEQNYFQMLVKKKHLENSIFLTGYWPHEQVLKFLPSFDVVVAYHEKNLPIYNVAVPTKILEYLAAGCKIVATNQKMYSNILTHKKDAYLTNQNPAAFAYGIKKVLDNHELSENLASNTYHTAKKFSIPKIVDEIEQIYNE